MIKNLLVTGYKSHELGIFKENHEGIVYIKKAVEKRLLSFIDEGLKWVVISGQLGVECWAGEVVIDLKKDYPDLQLAVLLPFLEQEANWKEERKNQYYELLSNADFVDAISKKPYESPKQLSMKNRYLVEKTDAILALYDEEKQGSPDFYIEQAKRKQSVDPSYEIHLITPYDLEVIYQEVMESKGEYW